MQPFTVLLVYPDYLGENWPYDTYLAHVEADAEAAAITAAQALAQNDQGADFDGEPIVQTPADFAPLLVVAGHHDDLTPPEFR
jgi:hypothetical protein